MNINPIIFLLILLALASCNSNTENPRPQEELDYFISGLFGNDSISFTRGTNPSSDGGYGNSSGNAGGPRCHTQEYIYNANNVYNVHLRVVLKVGNDDINWSSNYNPYVFTLSEIPYTKLYAEADSDEDDCSYFIRTGVALSVQDKTSDILYSSLLDEQSEEMYFFGEYQNGRLNADFNCTLWNIGKTEEINFKGSLSLWIDY